VQERLGRISYASMLGFLKQSNLSDLATQGAGGTKLPLPTSLPGSSANTTTSSGGYSGFAEAGVMTASAGGSADADGAGSGAGQAGGKASKKARRRARKAQA